MLGEGPYPPAVLRALGTGDESTLKRTASRPPSQLPALPNRLHAGASMSPEPHLSHGSSSHQAQLVAPQWANRPDTAGDRPTFSRRPLLQPPTESEALLNINVPTSKPMSVQTVQQDAPRAIGITQPSTVFKQYEPARGQRWDVSHNPEKVHAWRDHVDALMPPMSPVRGLNDSGMNMPVHKRLKDGPSGSGYIIRPPKDLEYSTSVLSEMNLITKSMANNEIWKDQVIGHTPRNLEPPELTVDALESSLAQYVHSRELHAVRKLQKAYRLRRHRAHGRTWRINLVLNRAATKIQQIIRRRLGARKVQKIRATLLVQRIVRGHLGRSRMRKQRHEMQDAQILAATIMLQSIGRRKISTDQTMRWRVQANGASTTLSKIGLGFLARRRYKQNLAAITSVAITVQTAARRSHSTPCMSYTSLSLQPILKHRWAEYELAGTLAWESDTIRVSHLIRRASRGCFGDSANIPREESDGPLRMLHLDRLSGRGSVKDRKQELWDADIPLRSAVIVQKVWRRKKTYRMIRDLKTALMAMRKLAMSNDRLELMEVISRDTMGGSGGLPFHGVLDERGNTLLHVAAQRNHVGALEALLSGGVNIDIQNDKGYSALHAAVMNQAEECLQLLLSKKANTNLQSEEGYAALHLACTFDNTQAVRLLGNHKKLKVNAKTNEGYTPLMIAAQIEELSGPTINMLLALNPDISVKDIRGQSVLHIAADEGNEKLLDKILERPCNVDSIDEDGRTALHVAAIGGHVECAHQLIIGRVDVNCRDADGWMAHHHAASGGNKAILEMIVGGQGMHPDTATLEGSTAMHLAATGSTPTYFTCIEYLMKAGGQPNAQDLEGKMPIHMAARVGAMETFSYLIEHPSCISEALDFEGQTPMFTALQFNQFNLGRFCCKMGCNYLHQDTRKRSMLMLAVEYHKLRWVEFFLRVGFDVTMKDDKGRNALHYAAEHGGADIIEMMSNDAKCDALMPAELFSAQDNKGWSPVHLAGHCGDLDAMTALIAAGSDIELQAFDGEVALHCACRNGHAEIVHALMQANAMQWPDQTGKRPIHIAALGPKPSMYMLDDEARGRGYPRAGFEDGGRKNDCVRAIIALVTYGVDINAKNDIEDGMSALHYAARDGRCAFEAYDSCDILIRLGASLKFVTHSWKTPQMLAAENNHKECAELLEESEEMTRHEWLDRQEEEEYTGQLMQKVYRGQMARTRTWHMRRARATLRLQKHWRGKKVRDTLTAKTDILRWASNVIGNCYKQRLVKIAFSKVLAKARTLCQAKLLQRAVEEEKKEWECDVLLQASAAMLLQRVIRGVQARRKNPIDYVDRLFKELMKLCSVNTENGDAKIARIVEIIDEVDDMKMSDIERVTKGIVRDVDRHGNTLLHVCAQYGNHDAFKILLDRDDTFVDVLNLRKNTPLHLAVSNLHQPLVRTVLRQGADLNAVNIDGVGAIHMATIVKNIEMINFLVKTNCDINLQAADGSLAMHEAAASGSINIANALKIKGCLMNEPDNKGRTPLIIAAESGHLKMCEFITKEGKADVEHKDNEGQNAVIHAALAGEHESVRTMLLHGASANVMDNEEWTLLHFAVSAGQYETCQMLLSAHELDPNALTKDLQSPMHLACDIKSPAIVGLLGTSGARLDLRDSDQRLPIHLAAQGNSWPVIQLLVNLGDNLNAKDDDGWTPLIYACNMGLHKPLVTKMLHVEQIKLDEQDNEGNTALHHAVIHKYDPIAAELVDCGASVNILNNKKQCPLHIAAHNGMFKTFVALTEAGASSFHFDEHNWSVLNYAIMCKDPKQLRHVLAMALNAAPPLGSYTDEGETPLVMAIKNLSHTPRLVQMVLGGARVDQIDNINRTALFHAIEHHNLPIVKDLIANSHNDMIHMDEKDVLPLHMCFICENVPQAIKVEVVAATPIDMLEEGYYDSGNSVHHYACMEGNLEIIKMLKMGGDMAFKRKNYNRKNAFELAVDNNHTECASWVQAFFDEVKAAAAEEKRLKDLKIFNAAARIQSICRGIKGRVYAVGVRIATDAANERARIAAENAAQVAEELRQYNAATLIQKVARIKLAITAAQKFRETRDERRRQDCLEIEAKAYAKAQVMIDTPLTPYYPGLLLDSKAISTQQEYAAEALRLCLDERMGRLGRITPGHAAGVAWVKFSSQANMLGSPGPLLDFCKRRMFEEGETLDEDHGQLEYPEIEEADSALVQCTKTVMRNFQAELTGCTEHFKQMLLEVATLAKACLPLLEAQMSVEDASNLDIEIAKLEMAKVEALIDQVNGIEQGTAERAELMQVEIDVNKVKNNQEKKNNPVAVTKLNAVLDKMAFLQQCSWEERALQDDNTRKQHQLDFYKESELCGTLAEALTVNMDKKGLGDNAEVLTAKLQHLTECNWSDFIIEEVEEEPVEGEENEPKVEKPPQDPLDPLGPENTALKTAGGVDNQSLKGMAELTKIAASAAVHKATWVQMEGEKDVWRSIREMMNQRYDLIDQFEEELSAENKKEMSGVQINAVSQRAWQLAMALRDAQQRADSAKMETLALQSRAEAIGVLKHEAQVCKDSYEDMLTDATEQATDLEEAMSDANAHAEALAVAQAQRDIGAVLSGAPELGLSGTLDKACRLLEKTAKGLRDEEANGTGDEEKEVDLADIGEMEQLAVLLKKAIAEIYKMEENLVALNSVQEAHLHNAFGDRPASRAATPGWPLKNGGMEEPALLEPDEE